MSQEHTDAENVKDQPNSDGRLWFDSVSSSFDWWTLGLKAPQFLRQLSDGDSVNCDNPMHREDCEMSQTHMNHRDTETQRKSTDKNDAFSVSPLCLCASVVIGFIHS